jgi:RNA polymerase sigma-70 factor (ECF subfamily)
VDNGGSSLPSSVLIRSSREINRPAMDFRRTSGLTLWMSSIATTAVRAASFEEQIEPYRTELHAHCYRMLGSVHDAEDALQDALLRAWRGLPKFEGRSSLRSWLYRIATNSCLRLIERRPTRVLPIDYGPQSDPHDNLAPPLVESVWIEPYPDAAIADGFAMPEARYEQRESVELAFVAALQHLPARQRAVLILRDVLGFSGAEVAEALETTPKAVYSALQRAHHTVDDHLPALSQQATLRSLGDARVREIIEHYVDAWERGDVEAIVSMLADDAILAMPPQPSWYRGHEAARVFLARGPLAPTHSRRLLPAHANGQIALGSYYVGWPGQPRVLQVLQLLTLHMSGHIAEITAFVGAELEPFGPPAVFVG